MIIRYRDKMIGETMGNVFITTRKPEHFMRKFNGFGISLIVLEQLSRRGIETVRIIYKGKDTIYYTCPLAKFMASEKVYLFENTDEQVFVSVSDMEKI